MRNARLEEAQAGIKIAGRNINNLRYAGSEEELKSLWMKVKEESEKAGLKLNIQKTKIMASGPITSWQIDGETVSDLLGLKSLQMVIAAMKLRHLLLGRKVMINLDSILKSRDITLGWLFQTQILSYLDQEQLLRNLVLSCTPWSLPRLAHWHIDNKPM